MASLLSDHVFHSLIAFEANPFQKLVVGHEVRVEFDAPRFGVCFGVGHGDFDVHVAEVAPVNAFGYVQRIGGGVSKQVEPGVVLQARRFHHKRVAIPAPDRIAEPVRVGVTRKDAAIGEDLAVLHVVFVKDRDERRGLDEFERSGNVVDGRNTRRHAACDGVVRSFVVPAPFIESGGPRLQGDALRSEVCADVVPIGLVGEHP